MRFNLGPSLIKHVSTNRLSTSTFSSFCVAFATADFTTFSISRVDFGLLVNFSVISASFTFFPRIRSTTSRAFWGDMRMNRLVALLFMLVLILLSEQPELKPARRHRRHRRSAVRPGRSLCLSHRRHCGL